MNSKEARGGGGGTVVENRNKEQYAESVTESKCQHEADGSFVTEKTYRPISNSSLTFNPEKKQRKRVTWRV